MDIAALPLNSGAQGAAPTFGDPHSARLPLVGTDTSRFRMTSMGSYVFTWPGSTIEKQMGTSPMRILFSSFGCAALIHINL